MLEGRGAGQGPTASAVVADLIDLARGYYLPTFGLPVAQLKDAQWAGAKDIISGQYIHLSVTDQPGVIADVSAILRDFGISIESMIQRGRDPGQPVSVVITTHECSREAIRAASAKIAALNSVAAPPTVLRIERF
jgi:homoserine dehydrogenase